MTTIYQVTYRIERKTKSGKTSTAANRYRVMRQTFYDLPSAQKFADAHPDPLGWTELKTLETDRDLLADIFHL